MRLPHLGPIALSSLQTMLVYALRLGVQVALLLLVARYLGPEQYGEFAGIAALAFALGTLSSFGLGFLVLGESAKSPAVGGEVLGRAIPATLLSAAVLGPLYLWLATAALESRAGLFTLTLVGLSELLLVPLLTLVWQRLQGMGQIWFSQIIATLPMAGRLVAIIVCTAFFHGSELATYAVAYFLASITALSLGWFLAGSSVANLSPRLPLKPELQEGSSYAFMKFTALSPGELDKALALRLLVADDAGAYSLAARGLGVAVMPVVAMVIASQPRLFRQQSATRGQTNRLLNVILLTALAYGAAAGLFIGCLLPPTLIWLVGSQFAGVGQVLALLGWAAPFMALRFAGGGVMIPLGRPLMRSAVEILGLLVLLVCALCVFTENNGRGIALAVIASEVIMATCFSVFLYRTQFRSEESVHP